MIRAACTIVSLNYLPYARTLCESFLSFHPDHAFYVLLVDRIPEGVDLSHEKFKLVLVEDLGIPNFPSVAFKYGILELNTNVKPTFLKRILDEGADQVLYFDPDILIYSTLDPVYAVLRTSGIGLIPHCTSPNESGRYAESLLLIAGVFNLGFIGLSKSEETERFLKWWEHRCLTLGYSERWAGLFVDQKWINLVPCYFDSVHVLKDPGCNVAYWNLHERVIEKRGAAWVVNGSVPLTFFHFSGMSVNGGNTISKHSEQFDLASRPDLAPLFADYRERLVRNGIGDAASHRYAFGYFDNGALVTKLQRAIFAANLERFSYGNPFDCQGPFYKWAKCHHLLSHRDSIEQYNRKAYSKSDWRIRLVHAAMRFVLRLLGPDRYTILMKYLEFAAVLRNQKDVFGDAHAE